MSDEWDKEGAMDESCVRPTEEEATTFPEIKYEYLDHPADVQIHAWGSTLCEAYEQAAMGMFGYMTDMETVDIVEVREVEAEAEDLQGLLFHFLDECLFQFCCEPFFIARKVVITDWDVGDVGAGEADGKKEGTEDEKGKEGEGGGTSGTNDKEMTAEESDKNEGRENKGKEGGTGSEQGDTKAEETGSSGTEQQETQGRETSHEGSSSSGSGIEGGTGGEATSNMKIIGSGVLRVRAKLFGEEFDLDKHPQGTEVKAITYASMQVYDKPGQHEVFVIVDI